MSSASNVATSNPRAASPIRTPRNYFLLIYVCTAYENHEVETRSRPDAFPSVLQLKRTTQTKEHLDANVKTKVSTWLGLLRLGS